MGKPCWTFDGEGLYDFSGETYTLFIGSFLFLCSFWYYAGKEGKIVGTELSYNLFPAFPGLTTKQDGLKWSLQIRLYFLVPSFSFSQLESIFEVNNNFYE